MGCSILSEPFFWPEEQWIPIPADWARNIVQGKSYDVNEPTGAALWRDALARLGTHAMPLQVGEQPDLPRYRAGYLARARLGQGAFRLLVTEAYEKRRAITGERTLPVLEAAHIQPFALAGPHRVSNGLLLRSDLHILFDRGYITVTPDLRVEVSKRIREEFQNGRDYYIYQRKPLAVTPVAPEQRPDPAFLRRHNDMFDRGTYPETAG